MTKNPQGQKNILFVIKKAAMYIQEEMPWHVPTLRSQAAEDSES